MASALYCHVMNVGLLCGSLGVRSANASLLEVAGSRIGDLGHGVVPLGDVAMVPAFDPALVDEPPIPVAELQRRIRSCEAIAISAPEYAAGLAGSTKNALDWLVGDGTIHRKVIGVASAGTTGGPYALEHLVRTISWQGGWVVATLGVAAPRTKSDAQGTFTDPATREQIGSWIDTITEAADATAERRETLVTSIVAPFGIDPARFGPFD